MKDIKEINLKFVNSVTFSSTPFPSIFNKMQILYRILPNYRTVRLENNFLQNIYFSFPVFRGVFSGLLFGMCGPRFDVRICLHVCER